YRRDRDSGNPDQQDEKSSEHKTVYARNVLLDDPEAGTALMLISRSCPEVCASSAANSYLAGSSR
ncbi:MAG: hypothetical protein ACREUP_13725, partial [Burkholderiales bacterium]